MTLPHRFTAAHGFKPCGCRAAGRALRLVFCAWWAALSGAGAWAQSGGRPPPGSLAAYKQMTLQQLMEVEITSVSRRPERFSESASAVQVVTAEDIRRSGVRSLPDALRLLPNLQVAQVDSRQWAISSRGFNNTITNKMLVLMDGRSLYTPLFAGVFWDVQDTFLLDVERIEAISGPGATQWGSNAVSGVINITTKSAKDTQGGLIATRIGTSVHGLVSARYGGALSPDLHYRVYGKYFDRGNSRTPAGGDAGDDWQRGQGGFRVDWTPGSGDHVTAQGDAYRGRIEQRTEEDIEVEGGNLVGSWTRNLAADSQLQLELIYDNRYRRIPGSITQLEDTYQADFQHRFRPAASHNLVWGLTYRAVDDAVTSPSQLAFLPARVTRSWWSGFIQDEVTIVPERLRFNAGLKIERNPYTGVEYQPSGRLAWKPRPSHLVWGSISRALRTPSRIDREFFVPASPPFTIAGGPEFRSEELLAWELGYRTQVRDGLGLSLAAFYHDFNRLRSLEPLESAPGTSVVANGLQGRSYGAELSVDYHVTPNWRLRFGYTEMRVHSRPEPGSMDRAAVGSPALDPNRQALLHSRFDFRADTSLDATLSYVAPISNQQVPGYTELDMRASWRVRPELELALVGRNLLHAQHAEFGAPATRREIRRSFLAEVIWAF